MKKLLISALIIGTFFSSMAFAQEQKMAATLGIGYSIGLGDSADMIDYALPLEIGFDYAVTPVITIGFDGYYWLASETAFEGLEWSVYQYGVSSKFWLDKAFAGIYIGALFARTNIEFEMDFFGSKITADEDFNTLGLKAGYMMDAGGILLDFGVRYDAVDFEFGDAFFTGYVAAGIKF